MAQYIFNDGGRAAAGFTGTADDCVVRAIAIATGTPYQTVYDHINDMGRHERPRRKTKTGRRVARSTARGGVYRRTYERYLASMGWRFVPTMAIGSGCRVHLRAEELPAGRIIVRLSRHVAAVVDGVVHDTHDPRRDGARCVYGYFVPPDAPKPDLDAPTQVVLGEGIVEVLQLDDAGSCRESGPITWEPAKKSGTIVVRGTRRALRQFQATLSASYDIEGPMWYKASTKAALAAVAKVIGPLHPNWFRLPKATRDAELEAYALARMTAGD